MTTIRALDEIRKQYGERVSISDDCRIDSEVTVNVSADARLFIGRGVNIMRGTTLQVLRGGRLTIGDRVNIGENVYIAAMSQIVIGEGSAISNMVDIHDHNHKDRTFEHCGDHQAEPEDVNTSGFETAPIVVEPFVTISNKVSITAGVRIGQNTKVGANAVVTRSLPPNSIALGVPARAIRQFAGPLKAIANPARLRIGFFGTSIMQHLEAYSPRMFDQMNLPDIGATVEVTEWRTRGYVHSLANMFSVRWPHVSFDVVNRGYGGANIRKMKEVVERFTGVSDRYDLVLFSCGINDVWRRFQGRLDEAVEINEFEALYRHIVTRLGDTARRVICLTETPVGIEDAGPMNDLLAKYNNIAARVAADAGVEMVDVWSPFKAAAELARAIDSPSLWTDGVHLSERGDGLLFALVEDHIREQRIIEKLLTLEPVDRSVVADVYPMSQTDSGGSRVS